MVSKQVAGSLLRCSELELHIARQSGDQTSNVRVIRSSGLLPINKRASMPRCGDVCCIGLVGSRILQDITIGLQLCYYYIHPHTSNQCNSPLVHLGSDLVIHQCHHVELCSVVFWLKDIE